MAVRRSAGILLYRQDPDGLRVLLAHMGGPLWARRETGAWTVPKGEPDPGEGLEAAARREFAEELGVSVPAGPLLPLGEVTQTGGTVVVPGTFEMEWPRGSGNLAAFPEVDRAAWWTPDECAGRLVAAQLAFVERLAEHLSPT